MDMLLAFLIGTVSGTIGAISTGGGLLSIPALIFLGLTPTSAIATTRLSALGSAITSTIRYSKEPGAIVWRFVPLMSILAVIAGVIGSKILLSIDDAVLTKAVGVILLLLLPVLVLQKNFGTVARQRHTWHIVAGYALHFIVMIYGALFGGGTGIFLMYVMVYFFGLTFMQSNATGTVAWLFVTTTAAIAFLLAGEINFAVGIPLTIGASLGGYFGAHMAIKKGNTWVKWFFVSVIVLSAIKLLS